MENSINFFFWNRPYRVVSQQKILLHVGWWLMAIVVNGSLAGVWAEPGNIRVNICKVIGCKQKFLLLLSNFDLSDCINYRIRKWMCVILNILGETCHGGLSEVVLGAAAVYTCTLLWFYSCLVSSLGADLSTVLLPCCRKVKEYKTLLQRLRVFLKFSCLGRILSADPNQSGTSNWELWPIRSLKKETNTTAAHYHHYI